MFGLRVTLSAGGWVALLPLHRRSHECSLERPIIELRAARDDHRMARDLLSDRRINLLCDHLGNFGSTSSKPNDLPGEDDVLDLSSHREHHPSLHGQSDRSKLERQS